MDGEIKSDTVDWSETSIANWWPFGRDSEIVFTYGGEYYTWENLSTILLVINGGTINNGGKVKPNVGTHTHYATKARVVESVDDTPQQPQETIASWYPPDFIAFVCKTTKDELYKRWFSCNTKKD